MSRKCWAQGFSRHSRANGVGWQRFMDLIERPSVCVTVLLGWEEALRSDFLSLNLSAFVAIRLPPQPPPNLCALGGGGSARARLLGDTPHARPRVPSLGQGAFPCALWLLELAQCLGKGSPVTQPLRASVPRAAPLTPGRSPDGRGRSVPEPAALPRAQAAPAQADGGSPRAPRTTSWSLLLPPSSATARLGQGEAGRGGDGWKIPPLRHSWMRFWAGMGVPGMLRGGEERGHGLRAPFGAGTGPCMGREGTGEWAQGLTWHEVPCPGTSGPCVEPLPPGAARGHFHGLRWERKCDVGARRWHPRGMPGTGGCRGRSHAPNPLVQVPPHAVPGAAEPVAGRAPPAPLLLADDV